MSCTESYEGNQSKISNQRRRQSLRIRKSVSNAKEPVVHKKSKKSTPAREPSIESLSVSTGSESEDMSAPSYEVNVIVSNYYYFLYY
ncbi:hypothetical protein Bca4012_012173 [Brassica carinata]